MANGTRASTILESGLDAFLDLATGSRCVGCRRPGRLVCAACGGALPSVPVGARPDPCPPGLAPAWVVGDYGGVLRALVVTHKEHSAFALARPLGRLLAVAVTGHTDARPGPVVLVPVPSRPEVVRARGHDPLLRLTRVAAAVLRSQGHRVRVVRLLQQVRRPRDQAGLDAESRRRNLSGSMRVRGARAGSPTGAPAWSRLEGSTLLLCDDVLTTGWTAREAQRAVEATGLVVDGIACVAATQRRIPASLVRPGSTH